MEYQLEKYIWTDADFGQMGWHDSNIYKISLAEDLELDIDYILKWNKPDLEGLPFTFFVAPATLVFKSVHNLTFHLDFNFENSVEISELIREDKNLWTINTQLGDFRFNADGYEQYIRQEPFFEFGQTIPFVDRFGYTLERTTRQENPNRNRKDVKQKRQKDLDDYAYFKKRHLKKQELEQLIKSKEDNRIDLKQYLLKKREISSLILSYNRILKGTRFERW